MSTAHRVRKVSEERYSAPLFFNLDYDAEIAPAPHLALKDGEARYPSVRAGEHLLAQTAQSFAYMKAQIARGEMSLPSGALGLASFARERAERAVRNEAALVRSAWAFGGLSACLREVESGLFDGVEGPPPETAAQARELSRAGRPYIAEICSGGSYSPASSVSVDEHFRDFQSQVTRAVEAHALFCSCLVGSDSWPLAVAVDFIGRALSFGKRAGAELSFETHRSRPTFHPWVTAQLLQALPELQLTCDFSHWCVVCERLPDDETCST